MQLRNARGAMPRPAFDKSQMQPLHAENNRL
ncbi:hypothetical protein NK6_1073 [Bradyrhizobium diazoefficiens]|uniref:Uncharacterized protein n=1 Tax=Bradyrhizobium diazoefficiens TaxID=1355477 RepID=A0A0E4BK77_9BRAD|nr:hypothetical protein NK6_1073 [Bradyrhizobium diazoefficiens]